MLWGVQQTRANGYINFSISIYARMGVLHLNPVDLFFPEKPTENCENQKITWEYLGSPKNKFRWVSPTAAPFYFYKSFWSVLRSQALETAQLGFCELYKWPQILLNLTWLLWNLLRKSCWTWPGSAPKPPGTFLGTFSGTLLNPRTI